MSKIRKGKIRTLILTVLLSVFVLSFTVSAADSKNVVWLVNYPTGTTLNNGYIYRVDRNLTYTANTGASALYVASGATVVIDIPTGYTLTVNGGSGSGRTGGGAGGGGGTYWNYYSSATTYFYNGGGGGAGASLATGGSAGVSAYSQYSFYDGTASASYRNYGKGLYIYGNSGSGRTGGVATGYSGAGGNGGSAGSLGTNGLVYKASAATVSGRNADQTVTSHEAVANTITLDRQSGTGGPDSLVANYGCTMANITIPTRDLYVFMGYYTGTNGTGTRYFDYRGEALSPYYGTSDMTLYAYWVQTQFNVALNAQGGSGGQASVITTGDDGTLPAIEQLPSREHYALSGFYQKAAGEGIQYYDETGASLGEKITANTTIYADWSQVQYPMTFNQTRGTGGTTSSWTTGTDGTLPEITVPTKEGYRFKGYFTETYGGGTKYYEEDGTPSALKMTKVSGITLYASWESAVYDITYTGMEGATNGTGNPATFTFGMPLKITNPVKEGYTFVGWSVNGSTRRYKDFTVTASDTGYAMDLILEATWMKAAETAVETQVEGVATNTAEINEALAQAFSYIVARDEEGVTVQDMTGEKRIKLTLTVKPADSQTDVEQIEGMAQGTALQFYDIKVKKEVITIGDEANPVITDLKEFPVPITIRISATGELDDKPSYAVYRVHDAIAEKLPVATETSGEYYDVANNEIVISTRKFSTYGVVASEKAITNDGGYVTDFAGGQEVDVQGRMVEQAPDKVYKMDMSWGDMKFEYSVNREWDASAHMYTDGALNDWRIQSYEEGNNRVQVLNHSNTDVRVNMNVQSNLEGVGMGLHIYNEQTAEEAQYFILEDAPEGSLTSQLLPCDAYLYLQGSPTKTWLDANKDTFVNVGNITVTVEAYPNG